MSQLLWKPASHGEIYPHAVIGGYDSGDDLYVGRANHEGDVIPGKVVPKHNCIYISWGGKEVRYFHYEVLVNSGGLPLRWTANSDGNFPSGAVKGGETNSREPLYVARAVSVGGDQTPGKLQPSHACCYIPYGGKEYSCQSYKVLQICENCK